MGIEVWLHGIRKLGQDNCEIKCGHFSLTVDKSNNEKKEEWKGAGIITRSTISRPLILGYDTDYTTYIRPNSLDQHSNWPN